MRSIRISVEIEGGVDLRHSHLPRCSRSKPGITFTESYANKTGSLDFRKSDLLPDPVLVDIHGSTWGGSVIRERFIIVRGMHLEFRHPDYWRTTTSRILEVQEKN